ncbi:major facilitator superfamily domain-containing protein [Phascolomyces articulosus]|uniref:Major facilitator superfamily domain-containing protein n=1 Tax=Phascolomyces articulosus TaxID=60185 RepID=A0AAD5JX29_9FUNG|nr:major facilitator superfamily domain-containing protein [Phascolomyces articulosus]
MFKKGHNDDSIAEEEIVTTSDNEEEEASITGDDHHHSHQRKTFEKKNSTESPATISEPNISLSVYKKLLIAYIVSVTVMVSPLSGQIYYPALNLVSQDFNISTSLVNISVTVYMIFQAFAPSFWGPLSDTWGRRPVYFGTLIIYIGMCVGLAMVTSFPGLLVLRMLQAVGGSSTIALAAGTIGDITTPGERGGYIGIMGAFRTASTAIGPVFGGLISYQLSWRWIFWILAIKAGIDLIAILLFVPETLRSIIIAKGNNRSSSNSCLSPIQWVKKRLSKTPSPKEDEETPSDPIETTTTSKNTKPHSSPNFLHQFLFMRYPDVALIMTINGYYMAMQYCFLTTTPPHFSRIYGLNTLQIGLCYLPFGFGCVAGSFVLGKLLNHDFRTVAIKHGMTPQQVKKSGKIAMDFPIYYARLRSTSIKAIVGTVTVLVYGWTLHVRAHISIPLVIQFFAGFCIGPVTNMCQTLAIDLFPSRSASVTAANNFVKCLLGAVLIAIIEPGIDQIGIGWMFTLLGLLMCINVAFIPILIKYGPKWRIQRSEKEEQKECERVNGT